jgi:bacterioferritin-associated ferredoxin
LVDKAVDNSIDPPVSVRVVTHGAAVRYRSLGKPYLASGPGMIVCQCHVVSDRAVADAVDAGARTLAGVCRSTGAGRDCGSCVFSLKRVLCEHRDQHQARVPRPAMVPEVDVAAS